MRPAAPSAHPSPEDLRRLLVGDLPEPDLDSLARHVEQCADCAGRLSPQLPDDALIAALRQPLGPEEHAAEPECQAALARLSPSAAAERDAAPSTEAVATPVAGDRVRTDSGAAAGTVEVDLFADRLPCPFGRYLVQRRLGKGGMGAVYLAHDTTLDRPVAVKVSKFRASEGAASERFLREARAAAGLRHDGVCRVLDCGVIDGTYYIAMDYVEGESLARRLAGDEAHDPRWAAGLVRQVALALAAVHDRGVIHRDLKPANIMLGTDGRPCVVDFGLARREQDVTITGAGTVMGTPAYMSPEQVAGEPVTPATDIYSLGVILYQLLTGRLPFGGENLAQLTYQIVHGKLSSPSQHRPDLDPDLESVCLGAMARSPEARYPTMAAFAEALDDYLRGTPGRTTGKRRFARRSQKRRPSRLAAALSGRWWLVFFGLLLVVSLPTSLYLLQGSGAKQPHEQAVAVAPGSKFDARHEMALVDRPGATAKGAPPEAALGANLARTAIYQHLLKSAAWIIAPDDGYAAMGSLIDRDNRLVLTCYHIVHGRRGFVIRFPIHDKDGKLITDRKEYLQAHPEYAIPAKPVAIDRTRDLALLQLDRVPDGVEALPLARTDPGPGDAVHCVSNPAASAGLWVYSSGNVRSSFRRKERMPPPDTAREFNVRLLETSLPAGPGDSGAACVNDQGGLVGIAEAVVPGRGITVCIDRSEAENFITEAFDREPQLKGKKWARSPRPPLAVPAPAPK
jgi:hypothetical protein